MSSFPRCLAFAFVILVLAYPARMAATPPPIESFFRSAEMRQPRLSKDGTRIVFLMRNDPKRQSIATYDVATQKGAIVFVPNDYNVDFAFWKGDRIVFGGDVGGNESYALRSIKADGSDLRDLSESYRKYMPIDGPVGGVVFSELPDDPDHILVAGYGVRRGSTGDLEPSGEFGLYRLNVTTRRRELVENWTERAVNVFVDDRSGRIYGRALQSGSDQVIELKNAAGDYKRIGAFRGSDAPWEFLGLLPGEKQAIMQVRSVEEHDRGALYAFDRETMQRGKLLYEPPQGELAGIKRGADGAILGAAYETDKVRMQWFEPVWAKLFASLEITFPGKQIMLVSSTTDALRHIVYVYSDRDPGAYYFFDAGRPAITPIGRVNSSVDPAKMAERKAIKYAARDGLEIHGYLTLPSGEPGRKHPLILLPHGGPFGIRDSWHFDPEAQFLASRGYAVLQVNFRGSGGYGAKFQEAGKRQWGLKMQDDLTDAVHWAVAQGIADADQVGIYGASYGGYAALAGLVFTPELYRCGVNYVGVSDLGIMVHPNEEKGRFFALFTAEWIGSETADLKARSPVEHVENIRVPTLHAYGENDPRVDIGHWKRLERALKKYNKRYVRIEERDEGHGFENENSRVRFYRAMEEFLGKYLPSAENVASRPESISPR